jgi:hypothetical protein
MKIQNAVFVSALALGLCGAAWTYASGDGVPAHTIQAETQPFFATHTQELGEDVVLDLNLSLLPRTLLADGREVRPLSMRAIFETSANGTSNAYLGESRSHFLCPVASAEPIDLSIRGLDIAVHTSGAVNEVERAYSVQVVPAAGKSWGEVANFMDDVVVLAARQ